MKKLKDFTLEEVALECSKHRLCIDCPFNTIKKRYLGDYYCFFDGYADIVQFKDIDFLLKEEE